MKKLMLGLVAAAILALPVSLGTRALADKVNGSVKADQEDFTELKPADWVKYSALIREYMYSRTQAVLNSDVQLLWDKYPDLSKNIDRGQGINAEKFEVETYNKNFSLLDANIDIESYEPIKMKIISSKEVVILVHGSITYLNKNFEESGGEYLLNVFLKQKGQRWTVVKTDEYTLPEYKEWLKTKK